MFGRFHFFSRRTDRWTANGLDGTWRAPVGVAAIAAERAIAARPHLR